MKKIVFLWPFIVMAIFSNYACAGDETTKAKALEQLQNLLSNRIVISKADFERAKEAADKLHADRSDEQIREMRTVNNNENQASYMICKNGLIDRLLFLGEKGRFDQKDPVIDVMSNMPVSITSKSRPQKFHQGTDFIKAPIERWHATMNGEPIILNLKDLYNVPIGLRPINSDSIDRYLFYKH